MDVYRQPGEKPAERTSIEEVKARVAAKLAAKEAETAAAIEKHNEGFYLAYEKALDEHGDRLVVVDVEKVGKCLFKFGGRADHAAFVGAIHKSMDMGPCVTYSCKCVLYPEPLKFRELLDKVNPEGFVKAALRIKIAMQGEDDEEGKG